MRFQTPSEAFFKEKRLLKKALKPSIAGLQYMLAGGKGRGGGVEAELQRRLKRGSTGQ